MTKQPQPNMHSSGAPGDGSDDQLSTANSSTAGSGTSGSSTTKIAAFFDLDKTLIARNSVYAFNRYFLKNGYITPLTMTKLGIGHLSYLKRGHDIDQLEETRKQLSSFLIGHRPEELRAVAEANLDTAITPYVYAEARNLIQRHRSLGHDLYIVSASAYELVEPIAQTLGVENIVATKLQVAEGKYTGEVDFFCRGDNKSTEIHRIADDRGYDLQQCFAYSDSATDIPMLSTVGFPIVVNPDPTLRTIAQQRSWPIQEFINPERATNPLTTKTAFTAGITVGASALIAGTVAGLATRKKGFKLR